MGQIKRIFGRSAYFSNNFWLFFCLMLVIMLFPGFVMAQTVHFEPLTLQVKKEAKFSVPLIVDSVNDLAGISFRVKFDTNLIDFERAEIGDLMKLGCSSPAIAQSELPEGDIYISIARTGCAGVKANENETRSVINLYFQSLSQLGNTTLTFEENKLFNSSGEVIEAIWEQDNIEVVNSYVAKVLFDPKFMALEKGNLYSLAIKVEDAVELVNITTDINYNNEILAYDHSEPSAFFSQEGCLFIDNADISGKFNIYADCFGVGNINGNSDIANIYFRTLKTGNAELTFSDGFLLDKDANEISANWDYASININEPDLSPPIISGGAPKDTLSAGTKEASLSLLTDENAVCKYSLTAGTSYGEMVGSFSQTGEKNHSALITGLTDGTAYKYYVKCADVRGNISPDYEISFSVDKITALISFEPKTLTIAQDAISPIIIKIAGVNDLVSATLDLNYDNTLLIYDHIEANEFFSQTDCFFTTNTDVLGIVNIYADCFGVGSINGDSNLATIYFKALKPGTTNLELTDILLLDNSQPPNEIKANIDSASIVITANQDNTPPIISGGAPKDTLPAGTKEASLSLLTDENAVCKYSLTAGTSYGEMVGSFSQTGEKNHSALITGLTDGGTYKYYVKCADAGGNISPDYEILFSIAVIVQPDIIPPVIQDNGSPKNTLPANTNQAALLVSTDENATCKYSLTAGASYTDMAATFQTTGEKNHSSNISGLNNGSSYKYYIKCQDKAGNASADYEISFTVDNPSGGGGGGGGSGGSSGGGSIVLPVNNINNNKEIAATSTSTVKNITATSTDINIENEEDKIYSQYKDINNLAKLESKIVNIISNREAKLIYDANQFIKMEKTVQDIYIKLMKDCKEEINDSVKYAIASFIQYGTNTTKRLGAGERAGVINSYSSAFNKLPKTQGEWEDIIKIANGRWPKETNKEKENKAYEAFRKIYLREPDRQKANDDAAITILAYGLRPAIRVLSAENPAIRIFKSIYKYVPESAVDWDIVRSIAYSGATR